MRDDRSRGTTVDSRLSSSARERNEDERKRGKRTFVLTFSNEGGETTEKQIKNTSV